MSGVTQQAAHRGRRRHLGTTWRPADQQRARVTRYQQLVAAIRRSTWAPNSRLGCEYDFISDTLRLRQSGFPEAIDSEQMFLGMFARLRNEKLIPW